MEEKKSKNSSWWNEDSVMAKSILKVVIVAMLGFAFVMFVFGIGIWVGQKRAEFSFRWAEEYHQNFGGPKRGIFDNFPQGDFTNGHGVFGSVLTINGDDLIIKGQDNTEKNVVVSAETVVIKNTTTIKISDINVGDTMVVIGAPNEQGQIEAKFIRILPAGTSYLLQKRNIINI